MNEHNGDDNWVERAFKRVADAHKMTVEEYRADLSRRINNPTPEEKAAQDKFVRELHATAGWYGDVAKSWWQKFKDVF